MPQSPESAAASVAAITAAATARPQVLKGRGRRDKGIPELAPPPPAWGDTLYLGTSEAMHQIPDASVDLVVTSPPYNVGKMYESHDDAQPFDEYLAMLGRVWEDCRRVLVPGGRLCVNVANVDRQPYQPLHAYMAMQLVDMGFLMRGEVIWNKSASVGASTAWGSWRSPTNPTLRDVHEYVLVFSKEAYKRPRPHLQAVSDVTSEEFTTWTKSIWTFSTESAKRIGHPAPFPLELPRRLIKLYSFPGAVILDPFCGSGSTCVAAKQLDRRYVGYDVDESYLQLAQNRLDATATPWQAEQMAQEAP